MLRLWKRLSRQFRRTSPSIGSSQSEPTIHLPYWIEANPRKGSETSSPRRVQAVSRDRTMIAESSFLKLLDEL